MGRPMSASRARCRTARRLRPGFKGVPNEPRDETLPSDPYRSTDGRSLRAAPRAGHANRAATEKKIKKNNAAALCQQARQSPHAGCHDSVKYLNFFLLVF